MWNLSTERERAAKRWLHAQPLGLRLRGDGYGYDKVNGRMTSYVHLNMGWTGQNDWWYNLPNIDVGANPEGFSGFNSVQSVIYDIMPQDSGFVASGRVLDADG